MSATRSPDADPLDALLTRLRERRQIRFDAPTKDGGLEKLVAAVDLEGAIMAIETLLRMAAVPTRGNA